MLASKLWRRKGGCVYPPDMQTYHNDGTLMRETCGPWSTNHPVCWIWLEDYEENSLEQWNRTSARPGV